MRACTQKCREQGHLEISVECDEAPFLSVGLEFLLKWIESEVASGRKFVPDETVQVGWSLLEVRQRTDGTLALFEPDFKSMPTKFIDGVSNTLLHMLLQKYTAESVGLANELTFPDLRHSAIVCTEFGSDGFVMDRNAAKEFDSGWFLGCEHDAHDHQTPESLRRVSLYEAAVQIDDRIIPFLALPAGTIIDFRSKVPRVLRPQGELKILPGSYLARKYVLDQSE
jgi:hypothetical protein